MRPLRLLFTLGTRERFPHTDLSHISFIVLSWCETDRLYTQSETDYNRSNLYNLQHTQSETDDIRSNLYSLQHTKTISD